MLNAAAVVAYQACFRHQPSFLASRRLRRISRANAFLRGLNALGSRLLCSSIDQPRLAFRDLNRKGAPLRRLRGVKAMAACYRKMRLNPVAL